MASHPLVHWISRVLHAMPPGCINKLTIYHGVLPYVAKTHYLGVVEYGRFAETP